MAQNNSNFQKFWSRVFGRWGASVLSNLVHFETGGRLEQETKRTTPLLVLESAVLIIVLGIKTTFSASYMLVVLVVLVLYFLATRVKYLCLPYGPMILDLVVFSQPGICAMIIEIWLESLLVKSPRSLLKHSHHISIGDTSSL